MTDALYDALDIDETEGIDPDEVKAAKLLLSNIKILAASVARREDTSDTLAILEIIYGHVKIIAGMRRPQAEQFDAMLRGGQVPQVHQAPSNALSGGSAAPTSGVSQQAHDKVVADLTNAQRLLGDIMSDSRLGAQPLNTVQDFADLRNNLRTLFDKAHSPNNVTKADHDTVTRERDNLKAERDDLKTKLNAATTALTDLKSKVKTEIGKFTASIKKTRSSTLKGKKEQVIAETDLAQATTAVDEIGRLVN